MLNPTHLILNSRSLPLTLLSYLNQTPKKKISGLRTSKSKMTKFCLLFAVFDLYYWTERSGPTERRNLTQNGTEPVVISSPG